MKKDIWVTLNYKKSWLSKLFECLLPPPPVPSPCLLISQPGEVWIQSPPCWSEGELQPATTQTLSRCRCSDRSTVTYTTGTTKRNLPLLQQWVHHTIPVALTWLRNFFIPVHATNCLKPLGVVSAWTLLLLLGTHACRRGLQPQPQLHLLHWLAETPTEI